MSVLRGWTKEYLETLDAGLFSGTTFHSEEALKELKGYLIRWQKRIPEIREELREAKEDWWSEFSGREEEISDIVARFTPKLVGAFSIAKQQKNKKEALRIMNEAWYAAPDSPSIHNISGWGALCDLCAE